MSKLSITGPDDKVSIEALSKLAKRYPFLEHAVLYFPEKEGIARNPTKAWREKFLAAIPKKQTAIHLCGEEAFHAIVNPNFEKSDYLAELKRYGRIQININARKNVFTKEFVHQVYNKLLQHDLTIIVQYHERSKDWILPYLEKYSGNNIDVLLDASLGRGVAPENFTVPDELSKYNYTIGNAGGISPENIESIHAQVKGLNIPQYYLDLESGVRTNNEYDLTKAELLCSSYKKLL